jgi:diguanylate cyclase (GGDEF)-like protein
MQLENKIPSRPRSPESIDPVNSAPTRSSFGLPVLFTIRESLVVPVAAHQETIMSTVTSPEVLSPELRVLAECLRLTRPKLRRMIGVTLPLAALVAFLMRSDAKLSMLGLWLGIVGLATVVLLFVSGSEPMLDAKGPVLNRRNEIALCVGLLGGAWGSLGWLAFPGTDHKADRLLILAAITGVLATTSLATMLIREAFVTFSIAVMVPTLAKFFISGDELFFAASSSQTALVRNRIENQLLHVRFNKMKERLQASESELNRVFTEFGEQSARDEVTGVFNRRQFTERMAGAWQSAHNGYDPFSCAFVEVENYERVVSQYGTDAGEELLRKVAAVLDDCLRTDDVLARLNGPQFAMLLNNTLTDGALIALERIRRKLASNPIDLFGASVFTTASIGLATYDKGAGPRDLLVRVDEALANARAGGTNRLTVWEQLQSGNTLSLR